MLPVTCPETVDLYDHLEGALSLDSHLVDCPRCRQALAGLRSALDVESAAFAPPSELEVERALLNVRARGQTRLRRPWGQTALAFAAAGVTLALLLPRAFVAPEGDKPMGGPGNMGAVVHVPTRVDAPAGFGVGSDADAVFVSTSSVGSAGR